MAIDLECIPDVSDEQIVKILRKSLVDSAMAASYSHNGVALSRHSLDQIQRLIDLYESRISDRKRRTGLKIGLAKFGRVR